MSLSIETVLMKARCTEEQLSQVRTLNLWGLGLKSLDEAILSRLCALEVLSLAQNALQDDCLPTIVACCPHLRELYLRKNNICDVLSLAWLSKLPHLQILWLDDNPVAQAAGYQPLLLRLCAQLTKLDQASVGEATRKQAEAAHSDTVDELLRQAGHVLGIAVDVEPQQPTPRPSPGAVGGGGGGGGVTAVSGGRQRADSAGPGFSPSMGHASPGKMTHPPRHEPVLGSMRMPQSQSNSLSDSGGSGGGGGGGGDGHSMTNLVKAIGYMLRELDEHDLAQVSKLLADAAARKIRAGGGGTALLQRAP